MALDFENYEPALMYGNAVINGDNVTPSTLPASGLTTNFNYMVLVAQTTGTAVATNLFAATTAPVTGTITGVLAVTSGTGANTVSVFSTTGGTIVTLPTAGTNTGAVAGTQVLTGSVKAGDTVTISGTNNNPTTMFVTFYTSN